MMRTAEETASILISLYDESFAGDNFSPFRINWPELRSLAGIARLTDEYLWELDQELKESGYFLFPLDNYVLVALESDFSHIRAVPPRIVEQYLPGDEDDDDDFELLGLDDEDDFSEAEALETLFGDDLPDVSPEPLEPKAATTGKGKGGKKGKSSAKTVVMSE